MTSKSRGYKLAILILREIDLKFSINKQKYYFFVCNPKDNDFTKQSDQTTKIRAKAKAADKVWDERYIQRRMKNNPPSKYSVGETVLIRFPFSGKPGHAKTENTSLQIRVDIWESLKN